MIVAVTGRQDHTAYEHRMWLYEGLKLLNNLGTITDIVGLGRRGYEHHAYNWVLWQNACGNPVKYRTVGDLLERKPDVLLVAPGTPEIAQLVRSAIQMGWRVVLLERMPVKLYRPRERGPVAEPPPVSPGLPA